MTSPTILETTRPWPFSQAELTAGLRHQTNDNSLVITELHETTLASSRPAVGRIRGLRAVCKSSAGQVSFDLVSKEPLSATRVGSTGAGRREVLFYRTLTEQIPIHIPRLWASSANGDWLALDFISEGRPPEQWVARDYLVAAEQLVVLHDRFWGLGEFLMNYPWLARPLDAEIDLHIKAASHSLNRILTASPGNVFAKDVDLLITLNRIVKEAKNIAAILNQVPPTLIHGDFWPGNLSVCPDGSIVAYDWQQVGIGPGILDVVKLIYSSLWWFDRLPLPADKIIDHYRTNLGLMNGARWDDSSWWALWDYALLWTFLTDWIALLADIPEPILMTNYNQLESLWLSPVREAVLRRLTP